MATSMTATTAMVKLTSDKAAEPAAVTILKPAPPDRAKPTHSRMQAMPMPRTMGGMRRVTNTVPTSPPNRTPNRMAKTRIQIPPRPSAVAAKPPQMVAATRCAPRDRSIRPLVRFIDQAKAMAAEMPEDRIRFLMSRLDLMMCSPWVKKASASMMTNMATGKASAMATLLSALTI